MREFAITAQVSHPGAIGVFRQYNDTVTVTATSHDDALDRARRRIAANPDVHVYQNVQTWLLPAHG